MDNSDGELICILNSDTYVCPKAFERIQEVMKSGKEIMIAGPTTCKANSNQMIYEYSKNRFIPEKEILKQAQEVEKRFHDKVLALSQRETNSQVQGFCFFLKEEAISKIGYFDEVYGLGNYDESDYDMRADLLGYKAVWVKHAYVHHYGQRSWTALKILKLLMQRNDRIWLNKMKSLTKENVKKVRRVATDFTKEILFDVQ